jgi:hypothetical protein
MKPEGAAITGLYHVLHLLGEDGVSQPSQIWPAPKPLNVIPPTSGSVPAVTFSRILSAASGEDGISTPRRSAVSSMLLVGFDTQHDSTFDTSSLKGGGDSRR